MSTIKTSNEIRHDDGTYRWTETRTEPGAVWQRTVTVTDWELAERTDCFCCSCGDYGSSDPYCRNHGFAGERPCETHELPGAANEDGVMPDSVQTEQRRVAETDRYYR
jgi:hypothetical protein